MRLVLPLTLLLLGTGCRHARRPEPAPELVPPLESYLRQPTAEAPLLLVMERTACEGTCPMYRLLVRADGQVEYFGLAFVEQVGRRTAKLSTVQRAQVRVALAQARAGGVDPADNRCPHGAIDFPGAGFVVPGWGMEAAVCTPAFRSSLRGGQGLLGDLACQLDRILRTERWVGPYEQPAR